jgi:hypothetical protein
MDVTRPVQRGGILLREHDGSSGDPGGASKMFYRPMDKRRALASFRTQLEREPLGHLGMSRGDRNCA